MPGNRQACDRRFSWHRPEASTTSRSSSSTTCSNASSRPSRSGRSADISARIALAEISQQLAPIAQAPPSVIRRLARQRRNHDRRARVEESSRLGTEDLVEIARPRANRICSRLPGRWWLTEIVTDALLARHFPSRQPALVEQSGRAGFGQRICHRGGAGGIRPRARRRRPASGSICRRSCVTNCLRNATEAVRTRLLSRAPPHLFEEIRNSIARRRRPASIAKCPGRATSPRPTQFVANTQGERQAQRSDTVRLRKQPQI